MSPKQPFADAVARQGALWRLLWVLERQEAIDADESNNSAHTDDQHIIKRKVKGWALMESLSSTPSVASKLMESSGWLELLGILVGYAKFSKMFAARVGAAKTLSRLLWDPRTGPTTGKGHEECCKDESSRTRTPIELDAYTLYFSAPLLQRFLPPTLVVRLKEEGPDVMLKLFDGESDTPELIWDSSMRAELRSVLGEQLDECLAKNRAEGDDIFSLQANVHVNYKKLADELFIGGVYVSRFLKEPTYNLRDPTTFLEMIMQRWTHEIQIYFNSDLAGEEKKSTSSALVDANQDILQLVTSACVYLCKVRAPLCDKLGQWGYMERSMTFLDEILGRELYGSPLLSVVRLLHVSANRMTNVESICVAGGSDGKCSIVDYTIRSIGRESLHPDTAFILEMLKRVFTIALGDVKAAKKAKGGNNSGNFSAQLNQHVPAYAMAMAPSPAPGTEPVGKHQGFGNSEYILSLSAYAMAPSPAPGEGYVQRGKVNVGEDPLGMFGGNNSGPMQGTQPQMSMSQSGYLPQQPGQFQSNGHFYSGVQPQQNQMPTQQQIQRPMGGPPFQHQPLQQGSSSGQYSSQMSQSQQSGSGQMGNSYLSRSAGTASSLSNSGLMQGYDAYGRPQTPQGSVYGRPQTPQSSASFGQSTQQSTFAQQPSSFNSVEAQQQPSSSMLQPQQPSYQQRQQQMQQQQQAQNPQPMPQQQSGLYQSPQPPHQAGYQQQQQQQQRQQQPAAQIQQQTPHGQMMSQQQQQPQSQMPNQQQQGVMQPQQQSVMQSQQPSMMQPQQPSMLQPQQPSMLQPQQPSMLQPQQPSMMQPQQQAQAPQFQQQQQAPQQFQNQAQWPQQVQGGLQQQQQQVPQSSQFPSQQPQQGQQQQFQVETVLDDGAGQQFQQTMAEAAPPPMPQYRPTAMAGSGIDARTTEDPKVEAEQKAVSSGGAPGAANGRVALLQAALVNDLPKFLLEGVLENPAIHKVKDPAATKVHTVDLLKLLTENPGYGMKFQLILDEMPAWKNYKSQDHSLFITGSEQKADYFLTDGSSGEPTKMLTQG